MGKTGLFQAACTVALLAATPALAQQTMTPPASASQAPAIQNGSATPSTGSSGMAPKSTMAPKDTMGAKADSSGTTNHASTTPAHPMRHAMMGSHESMHASRDDTSQNAAVNRLNDQSYQAAEKGQSFNSSMPANDSGKAGGTSGGKM